MSKQYLLFLAVILLVANSHAQTLFSIAGNPVTKQEFIEAYNKNKEAEGTNATSLSAYLELFINYKLKVHAARAQGLDTSAQQAADLVNYRNQVITEQLRRNPAARQVLEETIRHAGKDILAGHIFIPVNYLSDNEEEQASDKINEAFKLLQDGVSFEAVAIKYSQDPNVQLNKGIMGFVTAMVLPYELETVLYSTKQGTVSKPFQTTFGWHIFKNMQERVSVGRVNVSQILLAFPPSANETEISSVKRSADSIYRLLLNGAAFNEVASTHSDDLLSRSNGGELPSFSVGVYTDPFQQQAFSLSKEGQLSRPFSSEFGYHILKLNRKIPADHPDLVEQLKQEFITSSREEQMMHRVAEDVKSKIQFKKGTVDSIQLDQFTRNVIRHPGSAAMQGLKSGQVLFSIEQNKFTVEDYRKFLVDLARSGNKPSQPAAFFYKSFEYAKVLEKYTADLEKYDHEFNRMMKEFSDGNLLFTAMNANVWEKASADSIGLKKYFADNRQKYWWQKSVDAIIFSSGDEQLLKNVLQQLSSNTNSWKELADQYPESLLADSSRVEIDQLPVKFETSASLPTITGIQKSDENETYFFAYILRFYDNKQPREFRDAQGLVLSDYQEQLEKEWINELKKKYPVKINEKVFKELTGIK